LLHEHGGPLRTQRSQRLIFALHRDVKYVGVGLGGSIDNARSRRSQHSTQISFCRRRVENDDEVPGRRRYGVTRAQRSIERGSIVGWQDPQPECDDHRQLSRDHPVQPRPTLSPYVAQPFDRSPGAWPFLEAPAQSAENNWGIRIGFAGYARGMKVTQPLDLALTACAVAYMPLHKASLVTVQRPVDEPWQQYVRYLVSGWVKL
jgi:hypothetical protein